MLIEEEMAKKRPEFQLYNSMTKQKEIFKPIAEGKVGMYICGVTSYDFSHIGHARAYVAFDVLYRYLKYLGYEVVYVRNFTDVDDKIIRRANEKGEDPKALSWHFCQEFLKDMADLQCLVPTHQPRVTDHMELIKDMIAKLEDNRAGERIAVDQRKRNPADFALWKAAKPGEPLWDSPWGPGRPGWHIECSAMSAHYLTHAFDIHGGGMDLIFPHHENEIAQSCAACSESKVNYWMHNGFVTANDEKMSKSIGNFFTIREVTKLYHPLALRQFLLGTHYRSPVNYSISQLEIASESIYYIYQTLQDCEDALFALKDESGTNGKPARISPAAQECISKLNTEFETRLADDLHTPSILNAALIDALRFINSSVLQQLKDKALNRAGLTEDNILHSIEERVLARNNKEFSRSDQIRSDLAAKGIALMDIGKETVWRPCVPAQQLEKPGARPREEEKGSQPAESGQSIVPTDK
ncbi:cysteine--tRNA ligase [Phtheirospermum japonicum]|uniref:cysteine--tRNA ligase n=1 Tax=Phtheirospermum japonicum TaxID=374723 RepID=A0A830BE08_9LAMI|nr:cysteine--tRNA ligase [Phtheirospermum japonicum]